MDYPMFNVINDKIKNIPHLKEVNGVGNQIVLTPLTGKTYGDMSRFMILTAYQSSQLPNVLFSVVRIHSAPTYANINGSLVSGCTYNSDGTITISLSISNRVAGLILNDTVTSSIGVNSV